MSCGYADCPKTHGKIVGQLCEIYYPFGGVKCRRHFERWLNESDEVKTLHSEYEKLGG